ncbi:MAG: hypothetical protein ABJC13_22805 [Acidobacteriota bacterium]
MSALPSYSLPSSRVAWRIQEAGEQLIGLQAEGRADPQGDVQSGQVEPVFVAIDHLAPDAEGNPQVDFRHSGGDAETAKPATEALRQGMRLFIQAERELI